MIRPRFHLRLEPARPAGDPQRGFAAELADPAWMLGRQWQMGEHQGEDASSPLVVRLEVRHLPIEPMVGRPDADPADVPAEAIVEAGPGDWWTVGRRIRLGRVAERSGVIAGLGLTAAAEARLRFSDLTGPYESFNGAAFDGQLVHAARPDDPVFAEVPPSPDDRWATDSLAYAASFPCAGATLEVGGAGGTPHDRWRGHDGGALDWWSIDSAGDLDSSGADTTTLERWPDRFRWPGAPASRWWQIEDHRVDLGGLPPDRGHLASMLLLDLICGHADDWFLLPVAAPAGNVLELGGVEIVDSFGETWPKQNGPSWPDELDWSMFRVEGMTAHQLVAWPTATALGGEPIDELVIGVDEDANLVWAVEERLGGRVTDRQHPLPEPVEVRDESEPRAAAALYRYTPATAVPDHWHPYTREEQPEGVRFVQGRLQAVAVDGATTDAPLPTSTFLASSDGRPHRLLPSRLPPTGIRLQSRPMLARTVSGRPVLWVQRLRQPLLAPPTSGLRFDALIPASPDG